MLILAHLQYIYYFRWSSYLYHLRIRDLDLLCKTYVLIYLSFRVDTLQYQQIYLDIKSEITRFSLLSEFLFRQLNISSNLLLSPVEIGTKTVFLFSLRDWFKDSSAASRPALRDCSSIRSISDLYKQALILK